MKNLKLVLVLLLSVGTLYASSIETPEAIHNVRYNGRAYIFIEGGVEFQKKYRNKEGLFIARRITKTTYFPFLI